MRLILSLSLLITVQLLTAQLNLIPDGSFEEGNAGGTQNAYYYYGGSTLWRSWPYIGFVSDTENVNSGERSLKLYYEVYANNPNYAPTFRCEKFPPLEDATYKFSFYYKTNADYSAHNFKVRLCEGTELSGNVEFKVVNEAVKAEAANGFVQVMVEFETGKAMAGFLPFIEVPFITEGQHMYLDDVQLVKVVDTPEAWGPTPEHEATAIGTINTVLSWQSGMGAVKRNVYFGEADDALNQVATDITANQYPLDELENDKTYYWRVDEIDGSDVVTTGNVWSFTTRTFYDEYMHRVKNERIESDEVVSWKQFGPGNSGFVNFLRYHPLLPNICMTSPDMGNTYQTEDNGVSWNTIKDVDGTGELFRLYDAYYSTKEAKHAIAIECSRLFFSVDTGRSWTNIKHCPWYDNDGDGNDTRSWYRKVSAVALDPTDDDIWYVGAGNHCRGQGHLWGSMKEANAANPRGNDSDYMGTIWKTSNAGESWTALTTGLDTKAQFARIIVHPENSQMVFAASQMGLYKSSDGGSSWSNIGEGQLDNNTIMDMDYYYDKTSGKFILYLIDQIQYYADGNTTRNDGGIYKSVDNGVSFTKINGNLRIDINRLTGGVAGSYYQYIGKWLGISKADAQSQYPTKPTNAVQYFNSLNVDPSREDALYVGFYDAQIQFSFIPGRLYGTSDGGQNWINTARDYEPAWNADRAYWMSRNNPYDDNMEEGHALFNQQWGSNYPLRSLRYCAVNSLGDIMLLYAHNTFLSTDNGASFTQVDETYTDDNNIMGTGNSNLPGQCLYQDRRLGEGILYLGSGEHHLWRTANDGTEGRQAATYLDESHESVFAVVTHPWDENTVYTTSMRQHHLDRIYKSTDAAETFEDWGQATPAEEWMRTNNLLIDPINPDYMYHGITEVAGSGGGSGTDGPDKDKEGGFYVSKDAGKTFSPSNSGMPSKVWVKIIEFDPRDDTRASMFVAAPWNKEVQTDGGLFHTPNRGQSWTEIPVSDKIEGVNSITFDHTGRMYITGGRRAANLNDGGLFYSDDYGATWTQLFDGPFVDCIDVSPFDHNVLIISQAHLTKNPGVFISLDRGQTWSKSNHRLGQPDAITQVEFDLHDAETLWMTVMGSGFYRGHFKDGADTRKITVSPGTCKISKNETLVLNTTVDGLSGNLVYKSANESVVTVSNEGELTGVMQGAAKVWVTSEDGRYSDFVYVVVDDNDVSTRPINEEFNTLYPNPASSITFLKGANTPCEVNIYNLNGVQLIHQQCLPNASVDVVQLAKGVYLYEIISETGLSKGKLIKK